MGDIKKFDMDNRNLAMQIGEVSQPIGEEKSQQTVACQYFVKSPSSDSIATQSQRYDVTVVPDIKKWQKIFLAVQNSEVSKKYLDPPSKGSYLGKCLAGKEIPTKVKVVEWYARLIKAERKGKGSIKDRDNFIAYLNSRKVSRKVKQEDDRYRSDDRYCCNPRLSYIEHCKAGDASFFYYKRGDGVDVGDKKKVLLGRSKCNSWRHEGECARWRNAKDFARIKEALESKGEGWIYILLTLGKEARSEPELYRIYRDLLFRWDKLRKRLERGFGKVDYIATVEEHRDHVPHINLLLWNSELQKVCCCEAWKKFWDSHAQELGAVTDKDELKRLRDRLRKEIWESDESASLRSFRRDWLETNAVACGYGKRIWVEPVYSNDAIAGYMVKLCSEVAKLNQLPVCAPKGFRRLRASRGLLPGKKESEFTGGLILEPVEQICKVAREVFGGQVKVKFDLVSVPGGDVKEIAAKATVEFSGEVNLVEDG